MGLIGGLLGGQKVDSAKGAAKARPGLSAEANALLDLQIEIGKRTPRGQRMSAADQLKWMAQMAKVTTEDHVALRQYAANNLKAELLPSTRDQNPEVVKAAKGLVGMIDEGMLPDISGAPAVWIKTGQPANGAQMQAAREKGWAAR